jgi:hypothetical protein
MWHDDPDQPVQLNWEVILSITGSLAVSLALWAGLFRVVAIFVK